MDYIRKATQRTVFYQMSLGVNNISARHEHKMEPLIGSYEEITEKLALHFIFYPQDYAPWKAQKENCFKNEV